MKSKNPIAVALGKLAAGIPKTMSQAAINQRIEASKRAVLKRKTSANPQVIDIQPNKS
jgi:hypothetical protein